MKIFVGILALIMVSAGVYVLLGHMGAQTTQTDQATQTGAQNNTQPSAQATAPVSAPAAAPQPAQSGPKSVSALVAAGSPVTCTFSNVTQSGKETGTIYIANGMVAGDFTLQSSNMGNVTGHTIVRDKTSYVWTSVSGSQGFKTAVSDKPTSQSTGISYTSPMDYNCRPWTPDTSKFTLPSGISFMAVGSAGTH